MGAPRAGHSGTINQSSALLIKNSLRFNSLDSSYLSRTLAASQTRTYSFWYKYTDLSVGNLYLFHHKNSDDSRYLGVRSGGSPTENQWQTLNQGSSFTQIFVTGVKFRDPGAWQHFVFKCTASNVTQYINGVEYGSAGGANDALTGGTLEIGARGGAEFFGGYIADFHFVDGQGLEPTDFGFTDPLTNTWRPKKYTGTYGSNGCHLDFSDSSNIGADRSGNGNDFTANAFNSSDVLPDSPSGISYSTASTSGITTSNQIKPANWCIINAVARESAGGGGQAPSSLTISQAGLSASSTADRGVRGNMAVSSGKWYFEATKTSTAQQSDGVGWQSFTSDDVYSVYYRDNGADKTDTVNSSAGTWATFTNGDVIGAALDLDANTISFYKNGSFVFSKTANTSATEPWGPGLILRYGLGSGDASSFEANFGQYAFSYTPPEDHKALCTANLPSPTKAAVRPDKYVGIVTYTGDGNTNRALTGLKMQPDLVWIKSMSASGNHCLVDSVRGANERLISNATSTEATNTGTINSFNSSGFTIGDSSLVNTDGTSYVAWCWKAGGPQVTNTDGTITSYVSVSSESGVGIVTYTGTGTAGNGFGHGLGVAPKMVLIKGRSNADNWHVYHESTGNTGGMFLNLTNTFTTSEYFWNNTSPTSTVVTLSSSSSNNSSGVTYVAYCFSEVDGFSKISSYDGNGDANGRFVYCGFRPAWLMVKNTDTAQGWYIVDDERDSYNPTLTSLVSNNSDAESSSSTGANFDFLSNGFKLRSSNDDSNKSGDTYIFAAFAAAPINNLYGGQSNAR